MEALGEGQTMFGAEQEGRDPAALIGAGLEWLNYNANLFPAVGFKDRLKRFTYKWIKFI